MSYLTLLITAPLTFFSVLFALSNMDKVGVRFPFPQIDTQVPLSLLGLGLLGSGFLCGALFVWIYSRKTSYECWKQTRRANRLEKELQEAQKKSSSVQLVSFPSH